MRVVRYELVLPGIEPERLRVRTFSAREELDRPARFTVEAETGDWPDTDRLVGQAASLRIVFAEDDVRFLHGVVQTVEVDTPRMDVFILRVEVASRLALLALGRNTRMFQAMSVPAIVGAVLEEAGIAAGSCDWRTRIDYAPRDFVVQYAENDLTFLGRLLAEEGISFSVDQGPEEDRLVFFDDNAALRPIAGKDLLLERAVARGAENVVWDVRESRRAVPDGVMLRDYDPLRPSADLAATATAEPAAGREVYLHPGGFTEVAVGRRLAQRTLERLRVSRHTVTACSDCAGVAPGRRFSLEGCARPALNAEYVVTSVEHRGYLVADWTGAAILAYDNRLEAVPFTAPLRPRAAPAAPSLGGPQVAFVTVPAGEEIHADEHGRVKVRFPWDRSGVTDDRSSTWLRVGQLPLGGSMVLPRGGFEVLVELERGEIDRPYVIGHCYNGEAPPPYELPAGATRSSIQTATTSGGAGANELRFEDAAGAEEILLNASRDFIVAVENDASFSVTKDQFSKVGSNSELSVGGDHRAQVTLNRKLSVGASQTINVGGKYSDGVGGKQDVTVGGLRKVKCGGDHTESCGGELSRAVGALQAVTGLAGYGRTVAKNSTVKVGAAWLEVAGMGRMSQVGGSRTETVGALKMVKAKTISLSCGAALTINAAAESVNCGGARVDSAKAALAINAGGGLSVKAKSITIEGKGQLVMILGACMIRLTSDGQVHIKAPQIDLKGVKALNQVMHKSN